MSERYTRLFSLPENLGLESCPVVISAGALLKDNTTGNVLAQLKFRNLTSQAVKAVKVKIHAYDTAKAELNGVNIFSYLDLNVPLDGEFGSQTPIPLPDAATRSFTVDILSVVLAGGTVYSPIEAQTTSSEEVLDKVKQLDKGRITQAEKIQRQQRLFRLSFIPLLLVVIAFACELLSSYLWITHSNEIMGLVYDGRTVLKRVMSWSLFGYRISRIGAILAVIVPCMCILTSWRSKRFPNAPKIAFIISIACIAIQVFFAVYSVKGPDDRLRWLSRGGVIRGAEIFFYYRELSSRLFGSIYQRVLNFVSQLLYFAKNISAAVILYLQAKNAKSK